MNVIDNTGNCTSEIKIIINGIQYTSWMRAKPINPRRFGTRIRDAVMILKGKAIGVQYFEDLTEEKKEQYFKKYILKQ